MYVLKFLKLGHVLNVMAFFFTLLMSDMLSTTPACILILIYDFKLQIPYAITALQCQ
jgi:hypothetical protein